MSSGAPPVEPTSRPSDGDPAPDAEAERAASPLVVSAPRPPAPWLVAPRILVLLVAVILPLAAVAGVTYQRYAAVHLRDRPRMPRCVLQARAALRKPTSMSGSEPRQTVTGETVYLTPNEDRAVACAFQIDEPLSRRLATALAEQDPGRRAAELLKAARDEVSPDPAHDPQALAGYMMSTAAMRALPEELPEVRAASDELELLLACRFDTRKPCPTRPPIPRLVWITGVPAASGALLLIGLTVAVSASRLRGWLKRRKAPGAPA